MPMSPKTSSSTEITMSQIVLPFHANVAGNMHGGEVMKLMDSAAGAVAARHCLTNVVTASVTQLSFLRPVFLSEIWCFAVHSSFSTGKTSREVFVSVKAEDRKNAASLRMSLKDIFSWFLWIETDAPLRCRRCRLKMSSSRNCSMKPKSGLHE